MALRKQETKGHAAEKPTVDEILSSRARVNQASTEFLKIDVETALTFVKIAQRTRDEVRKQRNRRAARKAYETVIKFMERVELRTEDMRILARGLKQLRSELQSLGEEF